MRSPKCLIGLLEQKSGGVRQQNLGAFHLRIRSGVMSHGRSKNLKRGKTMYQPRRHLSQLHTTYYMPLMREKGAFFK